MADAGIVFMPLNCAREIAWVARRANELLHNPGSAADLAEFRQRKAALIEALADQ